MKRRFRLTSSNDFQRVRRLGKSYAHPLIVLVALPNDHTLSRFAVSAGRSLGKAVGRNRAKRLIRESLRPFIPVISPGWDILLLARRQIVGASLVQVRAALESLLERASLLQSQRVE